MNLRNIYLGLKDQMPLKRFIKNLFKGHVLGLFSKRSHGKIQARWNGSQFVYWNYSLGQWNLDTIDCLEDCGRFAYFLPEIKIGKEEILKEILIQ